MNRWDVINFYVSQRKFSSFLEIGTAAGETFTRVNVKNKVSVDPNPATHPTFCMTSDSYFSTHSDFFDIIFIDGLHTADQAYRDIQNALRVLNPGGVIVVHDCHPTDCHMQESYSNQYFWTGDVWKAFVKARSELPYECFILDCDFGCGVIDTSIAKTKDTSRLPSDMSAMTYEDFIANPDWMDFRSELP